MNCPSHCLIFKHSTHSYKELPIRLADFGVLHRNEISGALSGLQRLRRFQQDDAHIFCRKDQIGQEVKSCLDFLKTIYNLFGFKYEVHLSTRPENSLGSDELWAEAENQLELVLKEEFGNQWKLNKGDGAFYGPKIDVILFDAMDRAQQCGTIQLDFQLPIRFNLQYKTSENVEQQEEQESENIELFQTDENSLDKFVWKEHRVKNGYERPVIIHRAILGSVERFISILIEHLNGKWPLWLSPRQIKICTINDNLHEYGLKVQEQLQREGFSVELDDSRHSLNKKIRNATIDCFNYIVVIGEKECQQNLVDIRTREGERIGLKEIKDFINHLNSQYPEGVPLPKREFNHKYK